MSSLTRGPFQALPWCGSASTRSRTTGSTMNPHLMTSAIPDTNSAAGNVSSIARSHSTPAGEWKAPTRFLPCAVLMPVLPPTAASTMARSVVGTWTTVTPRSHVAATNPARSVTVPPPTPTTASERVRSHRPMAAHSDAATSADLASSPSGTSAMNADKPRATRPSRTACPVAASAREWMTSTRSTPAPSRPASSPSSPCPITTSYGESLRSPTRMRTGSLTFFSTGLGLQSARLQALHDLGCDVLWCPSGGQHNERREPLICRTPDVHHRCPLRPRADRQQGPALVEPHPRGCIGNSDVKKDSGVPGQGRRRHRLLPRAATQGQHLALRWQSRRDLGPLELAERRLPLVNED